MHASFASNFKSSLGWFCIRKEMNFSFDIQSNVVEWKRKMRTLKEKDEIYLLNIELDIENPSYKLHLIKEKRYE